MHRKQITFDYMQMETGEIHCGKIQPATRESLRNWLQSFTESFPGKQAAHRRGGDHRMALRR